MSSAFQERFKGKTSMMTKEGVDGVIKDSDNPIRKINERPPIQMEDFTGQHRYSNQKREAQTFDMNRPFFSPDRAMNPNIYSATYSKPNKSVDQHLQVHNQQQQQQQFGQGMQQGLPPRYPQQLNVISFQRGNNGMNEMDSIDQQMEQIKYSQQMQYQQQQQLQMVQASRQGFNSNNATPNNKIPSMKQTFQTDNGIPYYNSNGYSYQATSLNGIQKSNSGAPNKKPHLNAPISANLNNRNGQMQQPQVIPFLKGVNSAQSSNSTSSSLQQKNFNNYQPELIETKLANNGYNMLYNNMNNSQQRNSRELLMPLQQDFPQAMSVQQQPTYSYQMQNNQGYSNNLPQSYNQKPMNMKQQPQNQFELPELNPKLYSAKFSTKTQADKQNSGSSQQIDNQYEEAPFLKGQKQNNSEVKRVRNNQSRETTNKSFNEMPSSSNSLSIYKPYTLEEYKNIQKNNNFKLGGLGPNIGNDEWQQKRVQQEKRQEFSKQIQQMNTHILKSQQEQGKVATIKYTKEVSSREKALEFAKNIPKQVNVSQKQNSQSTNALGTNNTLPQQQNPISTLQDKSIDLQNKLNMYESDNKSINSRNVYSSINNYSTNKREQDPYSNEQENQPDIAMKANSEIDFHEQQHLDFLNQIEKMTK